ncbi:MAG: hypothetical protein IPI67_03345 [Myxococcales bacterium]|nr:hypothetical protein [Myxococcales bacterium]
MRTDVVVNPNAAAFAADRRLSLEVTRAAGERARVFVTHTMAELRAAAAEIRAAGTERVVLCGGDGTFMASLSALAECGSDPLPEICLAPGGTVATVAKNLGQRAGLVESVRRATSASEVLDVRLQPTLRVSEEGGATRVGFIFGTGLVARFFRRYYAAGAGGYATAARIVARVFVGSFIGDGYSRSVLEPLPCKLEVDGQKLAPAAYSLVVCAVVRDLGLHMLVAHRAAEDPERPHLVAAPLSARALGPQAPRVLLGKRLRGAGCFDDLVGSFSVEFPDSEGPYVLDGELLSAKRLTVSAGPRVRMLVVR